MEQKNRGCKWSNCGTELAIRKGGQEKQIYVMSSKIDFNLMLLDKQVLVHLDRLFVKKNALYIISLYSTTDFSMKIRYRSN